MGGCLLSRPQGHASYTSRRNTSHLKSYTATSLSPSQILFISLFFAAPSFYGDPSDDPDFLIPISTDYICICEPPPLSKWNLTMRRATLESNFQIIQKRSKIEKQKILNDAPWTIKGTILSILWMRRAPLESNFQII